MTAKRRGARRPTNPRRGSALGFECSRFLNVEGANSLLLRPPLVEVQKHVRVLMCMLAVLFVCVVERCTEMDVRHANVAFSWKRSGSFYFVK